MIRWPTSWGCSSLGCTWPWRNHRAVGGGLAAGQSAAPGRCWACFPVLRASSDPSALPKATISASELSLSDVQDKPTRRLDPGLMPLPDTAAGLEWSSLVNAAKAYEVQRAVSLFSLNDSVLSPAAPPAHSPGPTPRTTPTMSEELPLDLTGKVCQLEAMLKQLHSDLQKEKQDKVMLQAEVASLRQNNQRLQEESQTANEQLRKFAEIFSSPVDKEL
ncbi:unnamed protein product [Lepidochelys kempii]